MKKLFIILGVLALIVVSVTFFHFQKQTVKSIPVKQSVDETFTVEKYVRDNIKILAKNKPILGGSWYVSTIEINTNTKSGKVVYEDGHIQSTATFKYIFNNVSGLVTIENFSIVTNPSTPSQKVCTMESKQCSDGSYVGRSGPDCEFTACSTSKSNSQQVIRTVGEKESSFLIKQINSDSVDGLWYQAYPLATNQGSQKTLHIGDDIGYACEGVSEKLSNIDFLDQKIMFTKIVGQRPYGGCQI